MDSKQELAARRNELEAKIQAELVRKRAWEDMGDTPEAELCSERIDGYLLELKDTNEQPCS